MVDFVFIAHIGFDRMEMKAIFALVNLANGTKLLPLPTPGGSPGRLITSHYIQPGTGCQCACDRHVRGKNTKTAFAINV